MVPWDYDFTNEAYDGLFISNGPGDPKLATQTIKHIKHVGFNLIHFEEFTLIL